MKLPSRRLAAAALHVDSMRNNTRRHGATEGSVAQHLASLCLRAAVFFPLSVTLFTLFGGCARPKPDVQRPVDATPLPEATHEAERDAGSSAVPSAIDPCAERLHDLCGPLLMYYAINRRLPEDLAALQSVAEPGQVVALECPESGEPYVYEPEGFPRPNGPGRIIIYDATPAHSGTRWTVAIDKGDPAEPLIARVVSLPEAAFMPAANDSPDPAAPTDDQRR